LIIQPAPNPDKTFRIKLFDNFAETGEKINREEIMINEKQAEVIGTILKTSRYSRYFDVPELNNIQEFIKPPRFKHPFYGKPTTTVYPRDYVELDNFNEISKELLQASKYRERKDTISLKLINFDTNDFFDSEPFMLLDGIPIFDTKLLISKNSESIDRIDVLAEERCFGDMNFDGVLAVYSYDNKLNWLNKVPNLFRFNSQTVQFPIVKQNHNYEINKEPNIPDLRKVICWQRLNGPDYDTNRQVNFRLPDIKGNYLITITTITKTGNVITDTKEIEVR
ncbi:MAG: hypothetical protein JW833_13185, partial [Prolixibacteraceae bacterium]|nr:hypothetical protein [Prolixibacteraceae bacterium]